MSFRSAHRANIFCAKFLPSTDDLQVATLVFDNSTHFTVMYTALYRGNILLHLLCSENSKIVVLHCVSW